MHKHEYILNSSYDLFVLLYANRVSVGMTGWFILIW
jgi:hypothetical protein